MLPNHSISIGVDASNIRQGGGITHLSNILNNLEPELCNISKVYIWSNQKTLNKISDKPWLEKRNHFLLDGNLLQRTYWQIFFLKSQLKYEACDLLFIPGGYYVFNFSPAVTMNQNLLPFEWREIARNKFSFRTLKFVFLRVLQKSSFKRSEGVIFLSRNARDVVKETFNDFNVKTQIIPHGIDEIFFQAPRKQLSIDHYSKEKPFRFIYVSTIDHYKHQWNVVAAVSNLIDLGYPIRLDLYGSSNKNALSLLEKAIAKYDKNKKFIKYHDEIDHSKIKQIYLSADASIFSSSCETFGQIILESMASGLPIACSNMSAMPEILEGAGVYFNPLDIYDIQRALENLLNSSKERQLMAEQAFKLAQNYSWEKASLSTFQFLEFIYQDNKL